MFVGWGIIFRMQSKGTIFVREFPGYGKEHYALALDKFDDGKCYGGPFNTIECKNESGDCKKFNKAYPSCNDKDLERLHDVERERSAMISAISHLLFHNEIMTAAIAAHTTYT